MTIRQYLHVARDQLIPFADAPLLEAEVLLAHALLQERSYLFAWPEKILSRQQAEQFAGYLKRRTDGEPLAYIVGYKEFWSLQLKVNKETLIPRPETELLVETILTLLPHQGKHLIADLGTGSGAIALALAHERRHWEIYATDHSEAALALANHNAERLSLSHIIFCKGNWCQALPEKKFDIIVSNPPYIAKTEWNTYAEVLKFEPVQALLSGQDGLDAIREIGKAAINYLKPGGYLLVEHGFMQGEKAQVILKEANYKEIRTILDLKGKQRMAVGRYCP
jgi:release factor glutamine methyltransferase